jgi:tRNA(fMet)-specific endonuclease VapC
MRYLLDTDAVIDYLLGIEGTVSLVRDVFGKGGILCVCDVVIAEVHSGLHPRHEQQADGLLRACEFVPLTPAAARQAGRWRYRFARRGTALPVADALVAAAAHACGATLVTGNVTHYPMEEVALLPLPRRRPQGN